MDELEWLRRNSPPTTPSPEVTQRHRTELRAAIATEGADGTGPRRPRRRSRSRHRVLVSAVVVVVLCGVGAAIVAVASSGGDGHQNQIGAPASSAGVTTTTTPPTCTGTLTPELNIPADLGTAVAGAAPESGDPVEAGQQVTHWSNGAATFEVRWPADADVRKEYLGTGKQAVVAFGHDSGATVDDRGVARRRSDAAFPNQPSDCQVVQITVYGRDAAAVNKLADSFNAKPFKSSEPLVTTTKSADAAPEVIPCAGPDTTTATATAAKLADVEWVPTVGGAVARSTFAKPEEALADFVASEKHFIQGGYQELQLPDGSRSFAVEVRPGAVVTVVHVIAATDGWTVSDWSASGC